MKFSFLPRSGLAGVILASVFGGGVFAESDPRTEAASAIRQAGDTLGEAAASSVGHRIQQPASALEPARTDGSSPYRYFERPDAYDPWSFPIVRWQTRSREKTNTRPRSALSAGWGAAPPAARTSDETGSDLRGRYRDFVAERKHALALEVETWLQTEGRRHYVADTSDDHWPTLDEVLGRAGDDCDGLELLAYYLLRGMGFDDDEVYRAIVVRTRDDQHHMVTLWFETPEQPRVIDPTGVMATGVPRMSEVPGWVPLRIFSETDQYSVRPARENGR